LKSKSSSVPHALLRPIQQSNPYIIEGKLTIVQIAIAQ